MASGSVISFPTPAYSNVPIEPQFYQPSRFVISGITRGINTLVTTSVDHNYVIGQVIRLIIAPVYGSYQLNESQGYVISIPTSNSVVVSINSVNASPFISNPYTATITGATNASSCILTANNSFGPNTLLTITNVGGMTEINGFNRLILSRTSTTITLQVDSTGFGVYTSGGVATLQSPIISYPQILAVGDINSGQINTGRSGNITYINGSFINIS